MKRNLIVCAVAAVILALSAMLCSPAVADISQTYNLTIFNNDPAAALIGLADHVLVSDTSTAGHPLTDQVRFRISNGSNYGVITAVYFDDGLLGIASVQNSPGVEFFPDGWQVIDKNGKVTVLRTDPQELPGANLISFMTSSNTGGAFNSFMMSTDADNPSPTWGIGQGEYVDIIFDLMPSTTVGNVIARMDTGALRVGVKIQSLPVDSASAVSYIPAPAAVVLGLIGLGALGAWMRRYC